MLLKNSTWADLDAAGLPLELIEGDQRLWVDQAPTVHLGPCDQAVGQAQPEGVDRNTAARLSDCTRCARQHPELRAMDGLRFVMGGTRQRINAAHDALAGVLDDEAICTARDALAGAIIPHERSVDAWVADLTGTLSADKADQLLNAITQQREELAAARTAFKRAWVALEGLTGPDHLVVVPRAMSVLDGLALSSAEVMEATTSALVGAMTRRVDEVAFVTLPDPTTAPWWKDCTEDWFMDDLGPAADISEECLTIFAAIYHPTPDTDVIALLDAARTVVAA